jgi:hypothetical protein
MAVEYARKLAARLIADHEEPLTVDVPNHGFSDEVAAELEKLGYFVRREEFKPERLTIMRKKA